MKTVHNHTKLLTTTAIIASAITAAACSSDSVGVNGNSSTQLSFSTGTASAAAFAIAPVTAGGHTLNLTDAIVTVTRAELKRAQTDACPGDEDNDSDDDHPRDAASTASCGELKLGPVNVALPLDNNLVTLPANTIPAGTYSEFEVRVSQVELKGTFDGNAFDVTIPVHAKSEVKFSTPLVVTDGTPTSITVNVPVQNWLVNADGSLVDPNALSTNPSLMQQIRSRIAASFRAFEDRDHDGHDDHDGGKHGDG